MILARYGGLGDTAQDVCTGIRVGDAIVNAVTQYPAGSTGANVMSVANAGSAACGALYPTGQQIPMPPPVAPPPSTPWYQDPTTLALIGLGALGVGVGAYFLTR